MSSTIEPTAIAPPIAVLPFDTVANTIQKMVISDTDAVIMMDGDKLAGLITERDVIKGMLRTSKEPSKALAKDVMSSPVTTIEYNKPLTAMLETMHDRRTETLVTTRGNKAVGIVTERRILKALI